MMGCSDFFSTFLVRVKKSLVLPSQLRNLNMEGVDIRYDRLKVARCLPVVAGFSPRLRSEETPKSHFVLSKLFFEQRHFT